jgi:FMN-dependent NADH-azoreductase
MLVHTTTYKGGIMAALLYIEASPRKDRSHSIKVARTFLEAYAEAHPTDTIETLDLWAMDLPSFDGATLDAKYRILHGQPHSQAEADAWQQVTEVFSQFAAADKYLLSLPMWNFGIPYKLKHYIDVIVQPGLAFDFSPDTGYTGRVTGKPVAVVYARGGEYQGESQAYDFQKPYIDLFLGFIGFTDIRPIVIEPTLSGPEILESVEPAAIEQARRMAREF